MSKLIPQEVIENKILLIRGQKVMLDKDLAMLYGVPTKSLNLAVKRNIDRFPNDFMFRLDKKEYQSLRFQFETSKRGGSRYFPYVFTELGVAMLSSILNSNKAIEVNIEIMRAFVKLRRVLSTHRELAVIIQEHDHQIKHIFKIIRQLLTVKEKPKHKIGFIAEKRIKYDK